MVQVQQEHVPPGPELQKSGADQRAATEIEPLDGTIPADLGQLTLLRGRGLPTQVDPNATRWIGSPSTSTKVVRRASWRATIALIARSRISPSIAPSGSAASTL
jgi:hypothetical protein